MDSTKCKALITVLECGSLSGAAEILGYTPSGMSRMIASIEQDTGFPLLLRSRKGIEATTECKKLLPTIRKLSHYGEQYKQLVAQLNGIESGEIHIGTSYRTYYPWLMTIISEFLEAHPNIKIHLSDGVSTELLTCLEQHTLDLCIISEREGNFTWIPLQENPMVAWLPPDHPYAGFDSVPIKIFETDPYIETCPNQDTDNSRLLKRHHIKPNIQFSTTNTYATYCMVESGLGITLTNGLNASGENGNVIVKPLSPPETITLGIAISSMEVLSPAARKFVSFARNFTTEK